MRRNRFEFDRQGAEKAHAVQVVIATLFILGISGLLWMHSDPETRVPFATTHDDYLHAPSSDPSLPDLRATLRELDGKPEPEAPPTY